MDKQFYRVKTRVGIGTGVLHLNSLYASDSFSNAVIKIDGNKVSYVAEFKGYGQFDSYLFNSSVKIDSCVFFIPYNGRTIEKLYLDDFSIESIQLPFNTECNKGLFFSSVAVDKEIYCFGYYKFTILKLNIETNVYSEIIIPEKIRKILGFSGEKNLFARDAIVVDKKIYFVSIYSNYIFVLDTECNDEISFIEVPSVNNGLYFITKSDDDQLIIVPSQGEKIIKYKIKSGSFACENFGNNEVNVAFSRPVCFKSCIYLLPCWGNNALCLSDNENHMDDNFDEKYKEVSKSRNFYIMGISVDNSIIWCANSENNNCIIAYDCSDKSFMKIDNSIIRDIVLTERNDLFKENAGFGLNDYMSCVLRGGFYER